MRILLLTALWLLLAVNSWGASAFVQGGGIASAGPVADVTLTLPSVSAGNFLAACVACYDSNCPGNVWSSSPSNTWAFAVSGFDSANIGYGVNVASGSTTIMATPAVADYMVLGAAEFSGVKTSAVTDQNNAGSDILPVAPSSGSITTSAASAIIGCLHLKDSGTMTPTGGFTTIHEDETFASTNMSMTYLTGAAGSYTAGWTVVAGGGGTDSWAASVANFLDEAGVTPTVARRRIINTP